MDLPTQYRNTFVKHEDLGIKCEEKTFHPHTLEKKMKKKYHTVRIFLKSN